MPADIVIQRGSTPIPSNTETVDTAITLVSGDASKAFVRLASGNQYVNLNQVVLTTKDVDQYSCSVRILNATTVRCQTQPGGTNTSKRVEWEIWEYVGAVGGPNEFLVRNQANILLTGVGIAITNPWTMAVARENIIFPGGIIWEGPTAGAAEVPASGLALMQCDRFFGSNFFRVQRGFNDVNNHPRFFYTAVEFVGSNWSHQWALENTPPVGTTATVSWDGGGSVSDWADTFTVSYRRTNNHNNASLGMVVWPGTTISTVRISYPAGGSTVETFNSCYVNALYNSEIDVEHKDSITGGETSHPPPSADPQIIDEPTSGVPAALTRSAVVVTHDDALTGTGFPGHLWSAVLQSDGSGGFEVRWTSRDGGGTSRWAQQVIDFNSFETVSWTSASPKTLVVTVDPMLILAITISRSFIDLDLAILPAVGAGLKFLGAVDLDMRAAETVGVLQALAEAVDADLDVDPAIEVASKIIRGGLNPKGQK